MSSLEKYIEKVKEETKKFSDIEKLRYVYLDLGKRFSFNLDFSFGNSETKKKIYNKSHKSNELEQSMENNTIICKTSSTIYEYIMKKLGINIKTEADDMDTRKYPHTYNVVTTKENKKYLFDLQEDMRYIKAHLRTQRFGISMQKDDKGPIINRFELEQIDKKLKYITNEVYYTDEYLELIKNNMKMFDDFSERVQFALENIEAYNNSNMKYADRKWRMEDLIGCDNKEGLLFSPKERNKIHLIDCYIENNGKREYKLCMAVDKKDDTDIYIFSEDTNSFEKKTLKEFAQMTENDGLVNLQKIKNLRQAQREVRQENEER